MKTWCLVSDPCLRAQHFYFCDIKRVIDVTLFESFITQQLDGDLLERLSEELQVSGPQAKMVITLVPICPTRPSNILANQFSASTKVQLLYKLNGHFLSLCYSYLCRMPVHLRHHVHRDGPLC